LLGLFLARERERKRQPEQQASSEPLAHRPGQDSSAACYGPAMSGPKPPSLLLLALTLALGWGSLGCGKVREISACRAIAREVNDAVTELEGLSKAKPLDEPRIAKRYATLAKTLEPRATGTTALAQAVREYVTIVQATDVAVRNHAQALQTQYGKVGEPRRELDRLVKREHAAIARIQVECDR
jgi:hypothetical protein